MITLFYELKTFNTEYGRDKKSKFEIYLDGKYLGIVSSPACDGARLLLKKGYDANTLMTTQARDSQYASWEPQTLRKWAKLSTQELDHRQVRVRSFTECPRVQVSEGLSYFYDPTYLNSKQSLKAVPVDVL